MNRLGQDLRFAGRLLQRRPVLSAAAILTLTLGIGGTTAVFSLLNALLLRNLPVERPAELVRLGDRSPSDNSLSESFTLVTHDTLQRDSKSFAGIIAIADLGARPGEIEVNGDRRDVFLQMVSDNYFDVLGVGAAAGRVFHQPAAGTPGEPVAVISDDYRRRQFGADESPLGARFRRANREFTIVGVTPPGFRGTDVDVPADIWVSLEQVVPPGSPDRVRGRWIRMIGRLRPGVSAGQAAAETQSIVGRPIELESGGIGYSTLRVRLYRPLLLVAGVAGLVLLIACANLANLMLSATISREREIAVRAAIGASRLRIIRQLVTESLLLSTIGGVMGLVVARATSAALLSFLPPQQAVALPNLQFSLDTRVLGFAALVSLGTCLLFGVVPALRVTGSVAATGLKSVPGSGLRNRSMLGRGLLVGQVVMCTALLIVAGVFLRTLQNLRGQDAGYLEDRLLVADIGFPREYPEERRDQLIEQLRTRAEMLPGVEVAAFSHVGQLSGSAIEYTVGFPGRELPPGDQTRTIEQRISTGFLRAMGTTLLAGREFTPADDERASLVAIVNESFVRRYLPNQQPIGARFFRQGGSRSGEAMEIVGLVRDSKWLNLRDEPQAMYYRPYGQMGGTPMVRLALRLSGEAEPVARDLRRLAQSVDSGLALSNVVPFREIVNRTIVVERLVAQVSATFGVLALLIAGIGLYGVLAYTVARRRREIGVRIAIGARPGAIEQMVLGESLLSVGVGIAIGIPLAVAATRAVSSMLFGLSPQDPFSILTAIAAMMLATLAAAYLPARRAATIDPIIALREE